MANFHYTVIDQSGARRHGVMAATNDDGARAELRDRKLYIVALEPATSFQKRAVPLLGKRKLRAKELTLFTRQMASLAQVTPLEEALRTIASQNEKPHVRSILHNVHQGVTEGQTLSESLRRESSSFPPLYRAMIAAGEGAGTLPMISERLADLLDRQADMRGKLISALAYPLALALVALLVVALLMIAVVPKVVEQFDDVGQQLPFITRLVIGVSDFMASYWIIILLILSVLGLASWQLLKKPVFRLGFDSWTLRLPFLGRLLRDLHAARIARTLSTMVASRLPILEGLKLTTATVRNRALRAGCEQMAENIRSGDSLSDTMRKAAIFPPMLVYMTASGEASGRVDDMLGRAADYLEREFDTFTSTALSLLEPLIIVLMGGIVGIIILAILLPILQLQNMAGL